MSKFYVGQKVVCVKPAAGFENYISYEESYIVSKTNDTCLTVQISTHCAYWWSEERFEDYEVWKQNTKTEEFVPQVGDYFLMKWKTINDRSYIGDVWQCMRRNGDAVFAYRNGKYGQFDGVLFRSFDVTFSKISMDDANFIIQGKN